MRIHLGHHFYGAGNLGDDFMLAGFLRTMRDLAPEATFTSCVPFPLEPLRRRFPEVRWLPYTEAARTDCIRQADVWLGLGGSPFQSAQSRWFVDHLVGEAARCGAAGKPMFYLGIGVQTEAELVVPDVRGFCADAEAIWTRDRTSADRLLALVGHTRVTASADLAHLLFHAQPPPPAVPGRVCLVPNFDYEDWPAAPRFFRAFESLPVTERIWLAQESRPLPGAEKALHALLPPEEKTQWQLVSPDDATAASAPDSTSLPPGTIPAALSEVLSHWPSGEWLVTARYHAAVAGVWAGSKVVVIATNEKLRSVARELNLPVVSPTADQSTIEDALFAAQPITPPTGLAELALASCREFVAAISKR